MLSELLRTLATLLHAGLAFAGAPLLMGLVTKWRARLLGRQGPPVLQPYRDLRKLLAKSAMIPETASGFYRVWPFTGLAATGTALLLVPGFSFGLLTARSSDFVTLLGLFALSRGADMLAGLETGFAFGGAAAAREALVGLYPAAILLAVMLTFVLLTGDATVDGAAQFLASGRAGLSVSLGLALAAMLALALVENGRLPADDPSAPHELVMAREALRLEYSGRYLALSRYSACLRLMVWFCLLGTLFLPFGMARADSPLSWPPGLLCWGIKLAALAAALALLETLAARLRLFRVPEFLGAALLLGMLATILLAAVERFAG